MNISKMSLLDMVAIVTALDDKRKSPVVGGDVTWREHLRGIARKPICDFTHDDWVEISEAVQQYCDHFQSERIMNVIGPDGNNIAVTEYYLLKVIGDNEPELAGPFATTEARDYAAINHRRTVRHDRDGLYRLDVVNGVPEVFAYAGCFFKPGA